MSDERDIQQVIAKYVRAVDRRDGVALAELFIPNGKVTIFYTNGGKEELIVELAGREVIGNAMSNLMKAHPARGWSHHTTFDTIIEVDGERATVDAQFIVYTVVGAEKRRRVGPKARWGSRGRSRRSTRDTFAPLLEGTTTARGGSPSTA
jgi:hypothetical protein